MPDRISVTPPYIDEVLPGSPEGFASVAFLAGDKLLLGGPADGGGLVFDFAARAAAANDGRPQLDAPPPAAVTLLSVVNSFLRRIEGPNPPSGLSLVAVATKPAADAQATDARWIS